MAGFSVVEAEIASLVTALQEWNITSVELTALYLNRISKWDRRGDIPLNSVPVLNPNVFQEALASDLRRASGCAEALDGIPYTVKDSYSVKGLTVASGSPAFATLMAQRDAFVVEKLKESGAVLIGKTNMCPMAAGGMQRGLYGRAENPYNKDYLAAAFASGSSNGSGPATASSFCAFGLGEETVSSGRSPASNNGVVAYTPSRGIISVRGNWPLFPTCDVVVPHTRTVSDMLALLDVIVQPDDLTKGDFWRDQPFIDLPPLSHVRPALYKSLAQPAALEGKRLGVPKMYIGQCDAVACRASILALWKEAANVLTSLGAEVVELDDFPLVTRYEANPDHGGAAQLSAEWHATEMNRLIGLGWDQFLELNGDPSCNGLAGVDGTLIKPDPPGALPAPNRGINRSYLEIVASVRKLAFAEVPGMEHALNTLQETRKRDLEYWMDSLTLDAIVFPANGDIGKADSDVNHDSATLAWSNGVLWSNGNRALRHLGVPTTSVCMGVMQDTSVPVNLTFAGKAYEDAKLLSFAYAYEQQSQCRQAPSLLPELDLDMPSDFDRLTVSSPPEWQTNTELSATDGPLPYDLSLTVSSNSPITHVAVSVNGDPVKAIQQAGKEDQARCTEQWAVKTQVGPKPVHRSTETASPRWTAATVVILAYFEKGAVDGRLLHL